MTMLRAVLLSLAFVATMAVAATPRPSSAQSLAERISRAPDGVVRISYPARPGVCGDGEGIVIRDAQGDGNFTIYREWNGISTGGDGREADCEQGPVHVNLSVESGRVTGLRAYVGEGRAGGSSVGTDLGMVPAEEAARYLLSLAESAPEEVGEDAVLPAVLARDVDIGDDLLRIGRADDVPVDTREQAVFWVGQLGGREAVRGLQRLVADASVDDRVREHGIFALSQTGEDEDADYLRDLYGRLRGDELKEKAIFAVSQTRGGESRRWLLGIAEDGGEPDGLREKAIFWASQTGASLDELDALYSRLDERDLKEQLIFGYAQRKEAPATDRLLRIARQEPDGELREKAVFWLGQAAGREVTGELRGLVEDDGIDTEVREQAVFALSQRPRDEGVPALIEIARNSRSAELRKKALFWLGQSGDPRALDLFEEILRQR